MTMTPPPLAGSPDGRPTPAAVPTCVDLIFPIVAGATVPADHGYALFGAVSRIVPAVHDAGPSVGGFPTLGLFPTFGLFPIRGTPAGDRRTLQLTEGRSAVRARLPAEKLPLLLPLAGKPLELDGHRLRLGVPRVAALVPAPAVWSSLVLIKLAHAEGPGSVTPERFLSAARRQLDALGIGPEAEVGLPVHADGPRKGEPRRRVVRVREQTHAGYAVVVRGLTADESVRLQSAGLGGRRRQGCGLFLPTKEGE